MKKGAEHNSIIIHHFQGPLRANLRVSFFIPPLQAAVVGAKKLVENFSLKHLVE